MIDILKLAIALMIISMAAGLAIGITNSKTKDQIAEQNQQTVNASLQMVFPAGLEITPLLQGGDNLPDTFWVARSSQGVEGYAFVISQRGYAGDIKYMVGVDTKGNITGITVLEQSETPGLGSRITEEASEDYIWTFLFRKSEQSKPWFTEQFEGLSVYDPIGIEKSMGEWHTLDDENRQILKNKNSVTAITGSTISTQAVTNGLQRQVAPYMNALKGDN